MKKLALLIFVALISISCSDEKISEKLCNVCTTEEKKMAAQFVTENIGASNNMSDEEMEDVINELKKTALELHCHQEMVKMKGGEIYFDKGTERDHTKTYYLYGFR